MMFGDYRIEIVRDSEFWLDGGAMFGVVPRVLWERVTPPDEKNRIRLNMNCVFIDTGKERVLIDTGIGEKWTEREATIYGIDRKYTFADSLFLTTGCRTDDITIVVNTHLHFDHAGGNTVGRASVPQFKNARYLVSKSEFDEAEDPHERERASYRSHDWQPLQETDQLELMPNDYEVVPGLRLQTERGHSSTMQTWRLVRGGRTVYGFADLIPTRHHLHLPWIMGYDLEPAITLLFKKRILPDAVAENWLCLFYHDPEEPLCRVRDVDGKFVASPFEI